MIISNVPCMKLLNMNWKSYKVQAKDIYGVMVRIDYNFAAGEHLEYLVYKILKFNLSPNIRSIRGTQSLRYKWTSNLCELDI